MGISEVKLKAIIRYFCANTNSRFLGKTKLMKLFYFLDFTHIKKYGLPVTGDVYFHLEQGPIPSAIKNLVDAVETDFDCAILSDTIKITTSDDTKIHRISSVENFLERDKDYFSPIELETLEQVSERFKDYNTKDIVELSHKESPWRMTRELEIIPYTLAAEDGDCQVSKEEIELLNQVV